MNWLSVIYNWIVKEKPAPDSDFSRIEGEITARNEKYDEKEKELDAVVWSIDERIADEPLVFPEPDLEGLKPYEVRCNDSDDDEDIVEPFIVETRKSELDRQTQVKTRQNVSIYESSRQEENETEDVYSTRSSSQGLALILTSSEMSNSVIQQIVELEKVLRANLSFNVRRETIINKDNVLKIIKTASIAKEADGNCLLVLIATQVDYSREFLLCGRDKLATRELMLLINSEFSVNFAIKPKIVIQVGLAKPPPRRRFEEDAGCVLSTVEDARMPDMSMDKVPNMCHFFIASAIAQDDGRCNHLAEMSESFLLNLTEVLNQYGLTSDIIGVSTMINAKMKEQRSHYHPIARSKVNRDISCALYNQLPTYTSTLIRNFTFANLTTANVDSS